MVVGLVFHHTVGCGNLASFPTREEAVYHHFMWYHAVRDGQSFKAPAHIDLAASSLLLQDTLLDLFLHYWLLRKSLLCCFLFIFPTSNIHGPEILALRCLLYYICTTFPLWSQLLLWLKNYLKADVPKFVSILNHLLNSRHRLLDVYYYISKM